MTLPPWLAAQDFVGAMAKGASLGLTRRAQDLAAQQHAASLALQRDQMDVAQQHQAMQYAEAEKTAAEALRQHNALEGYRQQNLEEERRVHDLTATNAAERLRMQDQANIARDAHAASLEAARARQEERQTKAADALEKQRTFQNDATTKRLDQTQQRLDNPKPDRTGALHMQLSENNSNLRAAEKELADPSVSGTQEEKMARVAELDAQRAEIEKKLQAAGEDVVPSAVRVLQTTTPPDTRKSWFGRKWGDAPTPVTTLVKTAPPAPSAAAALTQGQDDYAPGDAELPPIGPVTPQVERGTIAQGGKLVPQRGKLPKDQAMGYLQKANGDKALARKLAIADGWEL